jgi:DNA-binding beta-propeller fold protein YncE
LTLVACALVALPACGGGDGGGGGGGDDGGAGLDLAEPPDLADDPDRVPSLTPSPASVRRNGTVTFRADAPVTFSVREANGGTISADGTYTAPPVVGAFTVVAARRDNPSVTATATVRVEFGELVLLAGALGGSGSADGVGAEARFGDFGDFGGQLAADAAGALYVVDRGNATIRKIAAGTDEVSTIAGKPAAARVVTDGTGAQARFADPTGIAVDPAGTTLFVSECAANVIRRVELATGAVTTLAGAPGVAGSTVGANGGEARFDCPAGLAFDDVAGFLYVADRNNHTLRRVKTSAGADRGRAELFAGTVGVTGTDATHFNGPTALHLDRVGGQLYVVDQGNRYLRRVALADATVTTINAAAPVFDAPRAIALFQSRVHVGQLSKLTRIEDTTATTTLAGDASATAYVDGTGSAARFMGIAGLTTISGEAFVADRAPLVDVLAINGELPAGGAIRKITLPGGVVTTRAGLPRRAGYVDGAGALARFDSLTALVVDDDATVYVGDENNWRLRKLALGAGGAVTVSTVAGDGQCCTFSTTPKPGATVELAQLRCMTITGRTLIACSAGSTSVAKIDLASPSYDTQSIIISGASPRGVAVKGGRTLYVTTGSDRWSGTRATDHGIFTVDLQQPATQARPFGNAAGQPDPPSGQSIDGTGNGAWFKSPSGLALDDAEAFLYVADSGHHALRRIDLATGAVTTIGGVANQPGHRDGPAGTSLFNDPAQLAWHAGALFIADRGNHVVRRWDPATGVTTTVLGVPGAGGVKLTGAPAFGLNAPHAIRFLSTGEMLVVFGGAESAVVLAR